MRQRSLRQCAKRSVPFATVRMRGRYFVLPAPSTRLRNHGCRTGSRRNVRVHDGRRRIPGCLPGASDLVLQGCRRDRGRSPVRRFRALAGSAVGWSGPLASEKVSGASADDPGTNQEAAPRSRPCRQSGSGPVSHGPSESRNGPPNIYPSRRNSTARRKNRPREPGPPPAPARNI